MGEVANGVVAVGVVLNGVAGAALDGGEAGSFVLVGAGGLDAVAGLVLGELVALVVGLCGPDGLGLGLGLAGCGGGGADAL